MTAFSELMQDVIDEGAFGRITGGIISNNNGTARRLLSISNRIVKEMAELYPWRQLWKTGTITLADGTANYALPDDFSYHHFHTFWNRGDALPMFNLTPNDYAGLTGYGVDGLSRSQFYIRGLQDNRLSIYPTPGSEEDGDTVAFEYICKRPVRPRTWVQGNVVQTVGEYCFYNGNYYKSTTTGTAGATAPTHTDSTPVSDGAVTWDYYEGAYDEFLADTDEVNLNERIFTQGVLERMSVTSGQAVVPLFERQLAAEWSRQAPAQIIDVAGITSAFTYARNGRAIFSSGLN